MGPHPGAAIGTQKNPGSHNAGEWMVILNAWEWDGNQNAGEWYGIRTLGSGMEIKIRVWGSE